MNSTSKKRERRKIEPLTPDVLAGVLCNGGFMVRGSEDLFVIDFLVHSPEPDKHLIVSRVFLLPEHFKDLAKALREAIDKYEKRHKKT